VEKRKELIRKHGKGEKIDFADIIVTNVALNLIDHLTNGL